jgi:hypothetical protein
LTQRFKTPLKRSGRIDKTPGDESENTMTDEREALRELVALRDIKDKYDGCTPDSPRHPKWKEYLREIDGYFERERAAWQNARAALRAPAEVPAGKTVLHEGLRLMQCPCGAEFTDAALQDANLEIRRLTKTAAQPQAHADLREALIEARDAMKLAWKTCAITGKANGAVAWAIHAADAALSGTPSVQPSNRLR